MSLSRLRIGQRVCLADDGIGAARGRIALRLERLEQDRESSPYLVLWEAGGESRCERSSIQPLGIGAPVPTTARVAGTGRTLSPAAAHRSR
jgi:hypothetical protein